MFGIDEVLLSWCAIQQLCTLVTAGCGAAKELRRSKKKYIYIYTLPQICIFLDGYLMGYGQQACATFAWDSLCVNSAGQLVSQLRRKRAKGGSLGLVVEAMDHAHNRGKHVFGDQTARMNGFLKCFPADHQPNLLF